ncbi:MAG: 50S ribosomal protein L18 [Deltaproteobacteria bacterium CG_4_8_14_3_um_filter_51_11]|nr:50S ribosomal protein L18 [bacterium]OIP39427.1 MAG: 50S ribosomal protein L18 [Desulfobacteraceae bacterium CG2_30_51_40]PIP45308.1 MAG: 50S ribosomal protein L18 [Deltaproteobacteria bacterium CG23_combo_of_CG06-09_8_20_14_all_51_20]PIW02162.1 MAG: 50S ribosomal protein L18 [Deltaproteobacteria bacterium CG17_big_fil_post_rev_8_21_14_2_50_51_6]PIX21058.1 MAG: 50S ribosomal protein L18 [Deltaproteobacteria bacterium CG_4_8_14_3_um_filter_51_11]PIY22941.1 MAG: 50S ribosomal protein L18 [Del
MDSNRRAEARYRRQKRVRKSVRGTNERPRLCVFRSSRHIYAQIIDDEKGVTIIDASSLSKEVRERIGNRCGSKEGASIIGNVIAERAKTKGISKVVFDRNGFLYHGRIKALSDGAREAGLDF